ncbi:MAG TPA: sulfurtransferase-like selenium metabolism protein YedF [Bacillota bacterium]|nr:sulfurtransferase-like selenium metabolism protein YedF [Bacillota bacterium]
MDKQIDARGLACPQPVILTKKALEEPAITSLVTIVDNTTARDNVLKLAGHLNCSSSVAETEDGFRITIKKSAEAGFNLQAVCQPLDFASGGDGTVLMITSRYFGQGNEELGAKLMGSFLYTQVEDDTPPVAVLLANSGAYLSCIGSNVLEHLQALAGKGCQVLTCGTCLDFYGLKEQLAVGEVTNMYTIAEKLKGAAKIINL